MITEIDFNKLDELYHSIDFPRILNGGERSIVQGFRKKANWVKLSDSEKLEIRIKELRYTKLHFEAMTPDLVYEYENAIIELGFLLLKFLEATSSIYKNFTADGKSNEEIALFRLGIMLYCELKALNNHPNLILCGHVLFDEIVEPIFEELKGTESYQKYGLQMIEESYEKTFKLYQLKPYKDGYLR